MTSKRSARGPGSQASIPAPPRAEVRPATLSAHGVSWADDYAWMRADNWREVLRDPARLPPDIRALLEAENAYADAVLAPTLGLQKELKREMRARLKEDDSEPPQVDGPWAYYSRFRPGGQRRIYCRKPREGGAETVLIDGDARAEGKAFFHLATARHSPDHSKFAWSSDELGSEMLTIAVRDLERETDLGDRVVGATGDVVWTRNSQAFLYVEQDESHRPCRVMLHRLGTAQTDDLEIFAEADPAWFIGIEPTRLGRAAIISVHGHDASEALVVDLDHPTAPPRLVAPRRSGLHYDVMDHGDRFFIRTNAGAPDFKIVVAPRDAPQEANWRDFVPKRDGRFIADATLFKNHLVLLMREMSRPHLVVFDLESGESHEIAFDEETYFLRREPVYEFDTSLIRFSYSSPATPQETYDYDVVTRRRTLVKRQAMPRGFDPTGLRRASCLRPCRGWRERAGVAHLQAGREARWIGAVVHHRLWRLRLCGQRRVSRPTASRWSTAASCSRSPMCAAARTKAGAGTRTASSARSRTLFTISWPPSASSSPKALPARAELWRRAAAPAAC